MWSRGEGNVKKREVGKEEVMEGTNYSLLHAGGGHEAG